MRRATIDNQEDRLSGASDKTFEEFGEDTGVDAAFIP